VVWMWEGGGKRRPLMMARCRLQTDLPHHTKYDELRIYFLIQKGISRPLARCIPSAPTHPYPLSPPTYSIKTPKKKDTGPSTIRTRVSRSTPQNRAFQTLERLGTAMQHSTSRRLGVGEDAQSSILGCEVTVCERLTAGLWALKGIDGEIGKKVGHIQ
jgi:hypothetical protein